MDWSEFVFEKGSENDAHMITKQDLKQEAIKRIKYWKRFGEPASMDVMVNHMQILGRIAELKDFFNITEEDLA